MLENNQEITERLIKKSKELWNKPFKPVKFTKDANANAFLNAIDKYPHGFVLGCLMDRQISAEVAWLMPYKVSQHVGGFSFDKFRDVSILELQKLIRHRAQNMPQYFYEAIQLIDEVYGGNASRIWKGSPSSATIVRRFLEFRGAGPKIASMGANILVRDFKIPVRDKYSIDISVDRHIRCVFKRLGLVRDQASNEEIIYTARELNPTYPGIFDIATWDIGKLWCKANNPNCTACYMFDCCATATKFESN